MEKKILNCEYSIFGDFGKIFEKATELVTLFGDNYVPEIVKGLTPIGPQSIYTLKSKTHGTINVMSNRIDVYFLEFSNSSLNQFKNILNILFDKYNDGIAIDRIAINLSYFDDVNYKELLNQLVNRIDFMNTSNSVELNIHVNDQCEIDGVVFNNIVYIQKGVLQNGKDFSKFDAMIFGFDFNSLLSDKYVKKFNLNNTLLFFDKLQNKLESKKESIFRKIEGDLNEK